MGQKLGIVSFTEHGSQLNERLREMLERSGYVCESYAAEKYAGKYHLFPLKVSAKAWTEKMFQSMYTSSCKRYNTYEWQERLEVCLSICRERMLETWTCSISRRKKEK